MHKNRIDALIRKIKKLNIDALLITKPENIFYLTSFSGDKIALIVGPDGIFVVTDFLYTEAVSSAGFISYPDEAGTPDTLTWGDYLSQIYVSAVQRRDKKDIPCNFLYFRGIMHFIYHNFTNIHFYPFSVYISVFSNCCVYMGFNNQFKS